MKTLSSSFLLVLSLALAGFSLQAMEAEWNMIEDFSMGHNIEVNVQTLYNAIVTAHLLEHTIAIEENFILPQAWQNRNKEELRTLLANLRTNHIRPLREQLEKTEAHRTMRAIGGLAQTRSDDVILERGGTVIERRSVPRGQE